MSHTIFSNSIFQVFQGLTQSAEKTVDPLFNNDLNILSVLLKIAGHKAGWSRGMP